jgi:hypothetical protein
MADDKDRADHVTVQTLARLALWLADFRETSYAPELCKLRDRRTATRFRPTSARILQMRQESAGC